MRVGVGGGGLGGWEGKQPSRVSVKPNTFEICKFWLFKMTIIGCGRDSWNHVLERCTLLS